MCVCVCVPMMTSPLCRLIRLSSPTLNYFIVGGALVMYASVLFYVSPTYTMEATSAFCNVSGKTETRP